MWLLRNFFVLRNFCHSFCTPLQVGRCNALYDHRSAECLTSIRFSKINHHHRCPYAVCTMLIVCETSSSQVESTSNEHKWHCARLKGTWLSNFSLTQLCELLCCNDDIWSVCVSALRCTALQQNSLDSFFLRFVFFSSVVCNVRWVSSSPQHAQHFSSISLQQ